MNIGRLFITSAVAGLLAAALTGPALAAPVSGHPPRPAFSLPAAVPSAKTATVNGLNAVSCTSASFCLAVGRNGPGAAAQVWNGRIWRALSVPVPGFLTGVSCLRPTKCLVVGDRPGGVFGQWWNGSTWRTAHLLNPPDADIEGVSCVSGSMCIAVGGSMGEDGIFRDMSQAWNGKGWRLLSTPDSNGVGSLLFGVSCTSDLKCMAVGQDEFNNDADETLTVQWNGTSWTLLGSPGDTERDLATLYSVSCLSSSDCMAVGAGNSNDPSAPLAAHWDGSAWTELSTPGTGVWVAVSCVNSGNCMAVGGTQLNEAAGQLALAAEWDGGTWQDLDPANPASPRDVLSGVSCTSGVNCLAAGSYAVPAGAVLALAERWDGATWQTPGRTGYLTLTPNGRVDSFNVSWYGSERGQLPPGTTAIGIAPYQTASAGPPYQNGGYLILNSNGSVASFNAPWYGSERRHPGGTPVAISADPVTGGYWILNANGVVHNYNAPWYGSERGKLNGTRAISIAADPNTGGYWILNADGGIANFRAPWLGSERGHASSPPVALVNGSPLDGDRGYVIVNANGSTAIFGVAGHGGEIHGHATGLAFDQETDGYWIINADGRIRAFGAPWFGSLAGKTAEAPAGIAGF